MYSPLPTGALHPYDRSTGEGRTGAGLPRSARLVIRCAHSYPASTFKSESQCVKADVSSSGRSEEHTSELQSRQYLVCRLLLEKKKQSPETAIAHYATSVTQISPTQS